jgi:hypothetical protein
MTVVAARVRKGLSSNRDKLPLIAALAKDELDYPVGIAVTDLTVGRNRPESVQLPAAGADHELPDASCRVL